MKRPILSNVSGGLSGPAMKPIALKCVWDVVQAVNIPVIGCGGIATGRDAVEFILAGATALEIGTAIMTHGVGVYKEINDWITSYMAENGFKEVMEMVGLAQE